jgi:cysteine desulfurase
MLANNEYGAIFPISPIAHESRRRGAFVHTDAVQAVGKIPVDVGELGVDLLSCSAHKFHGPKGIGALFVRRSSGLRLCGTGGGQERGRRSGTENTPAIVGFGVAARLARERLVGRESVEVARRRDRLERGLLERIPGVRPLGTGAPRLPNTSAILFDGVSGETLLMRLDLEGVAVSTGSACSSGTLTPSPAIVALGLPAEVARGVVRFSLSRMTRDEEIEQVLDLLPAVVAEIRAARAHSSALAEVAR